MLKKISEFVKNFFDSIGAKGKLIIAALIAIATVVATVLLGKGRSDVKIEKLDVKRAEKEGEIAQAGKQLKEQDKIIKSLDDKADDITQDIKNLEKEAKKPKKKPTKKQLDTYFDKKGF